MNHFQVVSPFTPQGDQPQAIDTLAKGVERGDRLQVLLGVTGSGKTFTMAKVIERVQRPTLVIAHNKTLAAQLCGELKAFFPDSAVEYFVSYYDYYQPEAYIAASDTYIEKVATVNDEIDKLRHSATAALAERRDVIIVASVSCIYGLGAPQEFFDMMIDRELLDLESKPNKAGGGYCTYISEYEAPFIFSNFNGTSGDVDVLTHEAGHAFAAYQARNMEIRENASTTMETAEVHSMTMELLARPWAELFFGNDAEKFRVFQLESALNFIPYGCLVDEFQHEVYENPKLTPQERKKLWLKLEKKYRPWLDFDNLPFFKDGGGFQKQHHIYCYPFYYIDYCLAQTVALEFWSKSNRDWKKAFDEYFAFVSAAGTKSFVQLIKDSGLNSPFEDGCVKELSTEVVQWMEQHRIK